MFGVINDLIPVITAGFLIVIMISLIQSYKMTPDEDSEDEESINNTFRQFENFNDS